MKFLISIALIAMTALQATAHPVRAAATVKVMPFGASIVTVSLLSNFNSLQFDHMTNS